MVYLSNYKYDPLNKCEISEKLIEKQLKAFINLRPLPKKMRPGRHKRF